MNAASEMPRKSHTFISRVSVPASMTRINVLFIVTKPLPLKIKYAMKTLASSQNKPIVPSLFYIASRIEDYCPPTHSKSAPPLTQTAFEELMLHPEKLEAAFKTAKSENDAFDASLTFGRAGQPSNQSRSDLKMTEFHLEAPFAESVKLAADFTDWERFPLDLIKSEDGVWYTNVPLPPGQYAYRFIVDGQRCDDPHPAELVPDPAGNVNAVVNVA
jgi:hypothetical protein